MKQAISSAARYAAREFADELQSTALPTAPGNASDDPVKIDVGDFVKQLSSGAVKQDLNQFFAWNHRWIAQLSERNRRTAVSTYDFIESEMNNALFVLNQMAVIRNKSDEMMELDGQILDLGVYKGGSTRALAHAFPDRVIHGFDSFEGLPGDWAHAMKGDFGEIKGALPNVPDNVKLYKGWFEDSLPLWLTQNDKSPISILRIDCDIYSSTKTIFDVLEPLIGEGTWIVFDELIGLRGWRDHEYKAFMEFIARTGFEYEYMAYGLSYTIARLGRRVAI